MVLASSAMKFRPETVIETDPQPTKFVLPHDDIGASKLKGLLSVAEIPATVMYTLASLWRLPGTHNRDVSPVHPAVKQVVLTDIVEVKSYDPKFNPVTVSDSRPDRARLLTDEEAAAASNENALGAVPTTVDTVNWSSSCPWVAAGTAGDLHCTLDADVHVAVPHAAV